MKLLCFMLVILCFSFNPLAFAQDEDNEPSGRIDVTHVPGASTDEAPGDDVVEAPPVKKATQGAKVGRNAASKHMTRREPAVGSSGNNPGPSDHYLAIHLGTFVSDNQYKWGAHDSDSNVGRLNLGLTYRVGEWVNSMDLDIRVDYQSYSLAEGSASKLSFLPVILFPDASSKFPLYFGGGAGLGVFTKQVAGASPISFDYQLLLGARFFDVVQSTGFFVEAGLKNHILLLSQGQFNGTFISAGAVFSF